MSKMTPEEQAIARHLIFIHDMEKVGGTEEQVNFLDRVWADHNKRSLGFLAYELRDNVDIHGDDLKKIVNRYYELKNRAD